MDKKGLRLLWIVTTRACGGIWIDKNDIIVDGAPYFMKFMSGHMPWNFNLLDWEFV
jgi:hypothetical protein